MTLFSLHLQVSLEDFHPAGQVTAFAVNSQHLFDLLAMGAEVFELGVAVVVAIVVLVVPVVATTTILIPVVLCGKGFDFGDCGKSTQSVCHELSIFLSSSPCSRFINSAMSFRQLVEVEDDVCGHCW